MEKLAANGIGWEWKAIGLQTACMGDAASPAVMQWHPGGLMIAADEGHVPLLHACMPVLVERRRGAQHGRRRAQPCRGGPLCGARTREEMMLDDAWAHMHDRYLRPRRSRADHCATMAAMLACQRPAALQRPCSASSSSQARSATGLAARLPSCVQQPSQRNAQLLRPAGLGSPRRSSSRPVTVAQAAPQQPAGAH